MHRKVWVFARALYQVTTENLVVCIANMNTYSTLFRDRERVWFERIRPFLPAREKKIIKIGNGFGHLSEMIRNQNANIDIFDISIFDETVNKDHVSLYRGDVIPCADSEFNTCVMNLTLHHVKNSREFLIHEVARVTSKRIILIEETYDHVFQKIHLVFRDWWFNWKASQPCPIHWRSYFSRNGITSFVAQNGWKITHRETMRHHSYYKELIVIDLA